MIVGRRLYRRYLQRRFGYDVHRGDWKRGVEPPTSPKECFLLHWAEREYAFRDTLFHECLWALMPDDSGQKTLHDTLSAAVERMRRMWQAYPLYVAVGMACEDDVIQRIATCQTAAWAATHISLKHNQRLKEALQAELAAQGREPASPVLLLVEMLPANTYRAWQERGRTPLDEQTLSSLRTTIARLVEHETSGRQAGEVHMDAPLQAAPQPHHETRRDNPTYEEVARHLEEEEQYMAWLAKEANLSALEADVTRLRVEEPPAEHPGDRFTEQEIADMLSRSRGIVTSLGSVKQAWQRAWPKIERVLMRAMNA
jgi:hypothetical protein